MHSKFELFMSLLEKAKQMKPATNMIESLAAGTSEAFRKLFTCDLCRMFPILASQLL
jgi:hypothetical protein